MTYQLIVMTFDGNYKTEPPEFENTDDAWTYANNLGSKWYFYPFRFVVNQAGEIADAPEPMRHLEGMTVQDVASHFREISESPEASGVDVEVYAFMV